MDMNEKENVSRKSESIDKGNVTVLNTDVSCPGHPHFILNNKIQEDVLHECWN